MKWLFLVFLINGCASNGFYYVQSEALNSVLVMECRTVVFGHSENPGDIKHTQQCRRFFMTPDQMAGWKATQQSIQDRNLPDGIVVED